MSNREGPILVLGVGNVLLRDDGVGVHVVRELGRLADRGEMELPPGTTVVDGGTLGLALLPLISDARALVLVDAIECGGTPGGVRVIRGDALFGAQTPDVRPILAGIDDLLATARLIGALPVAVSLVGIEPGEVEAGLELTAAVRAALPAAIAATLDEIRRSGAIAPTSTASPAGRPSDGKGMAA